MYLSSITFYRDSYPTYREASSNASKKLIYLTKHSKLAEILGGKSINAFLCMYACSGTFLDFRRFQIPYDLRPIPEIQFYLKEVAFKVDRHLENIQILGDRINKPEKPRVIMSLENRKQTLLRHLLIPVNVNFR